MEQFDYYETADGFQVTGPRLTNPHLDKAKGWTVALVSQMVDSLNQLAIEPRLCPNCIRYI